MNVFDLAAGRDWALGEADLLSIMTIAARAGEGPEAVALRLGRPLENTRSVEMHGPVAVVPLDGPMFRRANLLTEISGATSTEQFAQDIQAALDNPAVAAMVLDITSPGGEAAGVNEVANAIFAARGTKPIIAYVGSQASSGGYWIASAADRVIVDATASVGSIGVVSRYVKMTDRPGVVSVTEIVSTQSPRKRLDPETDAGRADIQRQVDAIAQVFIEAVARNRGVDVPAVTADFGQGGVEIGAEAVRRGMADALGSLESVIADLTRKSPLGVAGPIQRRPLMAALQAAAAIVEPVTAAVLVAQYPDAAEALRAEGRAQQIQLGGPEIAAARIAAANAERARILEIEAAALPGYAALATQAIEAGSSPAEFALAQAKAQKAAGADHLAALRADENAAAVLAAPPAPPATPTIDRSLPVEERARREWDSKPAVRSEFGGEFKHFLAYMKNDEAGNIRRIAPRGV